VSIFAWNELRLVHECLVVESCDNLKEYHLRLRCFRGTNIKILLFELFSFWERQEGKMFTGSKDLYLCFKVEFVSCGTVWQQNLHSASRFLEIFLWECVAWLFSKIKWGGEQSTSIQKLFLSLEQKPIGISGFENVNRFHRPPLWSSGQSSWLQIRKPGFDSRHYQKKKSSGSGTGSTQPREYNWGATW
jgi:hypothetical protein